jgi:hypothetical protein
VLHHSRLPVLIVHAEPGTPGMRPMAAPPGLD